jgi:hypothetical protein
MTHIRLILALLLVLLLLFGIACLVPEPELGHGASHDTIDGPMLKGGDGSRHLDIYWIGVCLALVEVLLFVTLLSFGLRPVPGKLPRLAAAGVVFAATMIAMLATYWNSIPASSGEPPSIVLGLPVPTAWMIYGLGLVPLIFAFFYISKFDSWVLSPEDEQRLADLVAQAATSDEEGGA